jgi:hypothetical protein
MDGLAVWGLSDVALRLHDTQGLKARATAHNAVKDLNVSNLAHEVCKASGQFRGLANVPPLSSGRISKRGGGR